MKIKLSKNNNRPAKSVFVQFYRETEQNVENGGKLKKNGKKIIMCDSSSSDNEEINVNVNMN